MMLPAGAQDSCAPTWRDENDCARWDSDFWLSDAGSELQ